VSIGDKYFATWGYVYIFAIEKVFETCANKPKVKYRLLCFYRYSKENYILMICTKIIEHGLNFDIGKMRNDIILIKNARKRKDED